MNEDAAAPSDRDDADGGPAGFPWGDGRLALAWLIDDRDRGDGCHPPRSGHWHGMEHTGGPVAVRC